MKKFTFILAALFAANMVNAQIYLEKTVSGRMSNWLDIEDFYFDCGKLPIVYGDTVVELYNDDMTLYKTVRFAPSNVSNPKAPSTNSVKRSPAAYKGGPSSGMFLFAKNLYTTDGKIGFIRWSNWHVAVYDEDGQMVCDLQDMGDPNCGIFSVNGKWKFVIQTDVWSWDEEAQTGKAEYTTYIYSLPGNGDMSEDILVPSSPRKSAARKLLRQNQVMIENAGGTYTLTGQEIK